VQTESFTAHRTLRPGVVRVEATLGNFAFPSHSHEHVCIGLARDGEHDCRYGLRRHIVEKGDLMLVNPGEVHDGKPSGRHGRRYSMLEVNADTFRLLCRDAIDAEQFEFKRAVLRAPCAGDALAAWLESLSGCDTRVERDAGAAFFGLVAGRALDLRRPKATRGLATIVAQQMREQGPEVDSIGEIGAQRGISRFQLIRAFKQAFGLTPEDFRRQLRVERARALLAGPRRLSEIALCAGFADQSHMTREFRRLVGLSPGYYRRALQ
jgi:AraC-like DNA-binding protein